MSARRVTRRRSLLACVAVLLAALAVPGVTGLTSSSAATAAALPAGCVKPHGPALVLCSYSSDDVFTVPTGVSLLDLTAIGGHGGDGDQLGLSCPASAGAGGQGAETAEKAVPVTPNTALLVNVGGNGQTATAGAGGGGAHGGGAGVAGSSGITTSGSSGGGGGASSVESGATDLIAAAGGGGGGGAYTVIGFPACGEAGGSAGEGGAPAGNGGGQPGTAAGPGLGGPGGGAAGAGGAGGMGAPGIGGGGGGGGVFGGGGGGAGSGGGGGYNPRYQVSTLAPLTAAPAVTISYVARGYPRINVTSRTGSGPVTIAGISVPKTATFLLARRYGDGVFTSVASLTSGANGAYSFSGTITRTTDFAVVADGRVSRTATASVTDLVKVFAGSKPGRKAGTASVKVSVRTDPAVHGVTDTLYAKDSHGKLHKLSRKTIQKLNGRNTFSVTTKKSRLTLVVKVAAGDGALGGSATRKISTHRR